MAVLLSTPTTLTVASADAAPLGAQGSTAEIPHRVVHDDATGDVASWAEPDEPAAATAAPRDHSNDIVRTTINHRAHRLSMELDLQKVRRTGRRYLVSQVATAGGRSYDVMVDYSKHHHGKRIEITTARGKSVTCLGVSFSTTPAAAQLTLSVPRSCLGDPRWVRVGVGTGWFSADYAHIHGDDSRINGLAGNDLVLGPRQPHA